MSETDSCFDASSHSPPLSELLRLAPRAPAGHWSESLAAAGDAQTAHSLWRAFAQAEAALDAQALDELRAQLQREVQDNGITYNVYADNEDPKRPWALDLFPVLLSAEEWAHVTRGVQQRMAVLEAILADAYGPQALINQGLLPAALVQGHPSYLPAMHGVAPVGGRYLNVMAFDLARGPDGHWCLLSQRSQAPSGLGYLLENRALIARLFPQAFDALAVQRLAPVYQTWLDGIRARCACDEGERPHLALLTPGPYNETYVEHAYLARHLGLTLVQADDLTVRGQRVYLKTLSGLQRVHAIWKRVDDLWLDPLELRADSSLGVPGLLQAIRAQQVLVINQPGSGFLESSALLGFMPALAEHLLGERLLLPAIPSWWCGDSAAWADAQAQLGDGVIKPSYPPGQQQHSFEPVLSHSLSNAQRAQWLAAIAQDPDAHTIQRWLALSHQPVWRAPSDGPGQWQTRPLVLRVFALADAQGGIHVVPGGLARLGTRDGISSMQRGGSSADVWVTQAGRAPTGATHNTGPTPAPGRLRTPPAPIAARAVTSRAAENLHWIGRYTERSELCLRLTHTALTHRHGDDDSDAVPGWLLSLASHIGLLRSEDLPAEPQALSARSWMRNLWDTQDTTGLAYNLSALRRAANTVRERLDATHWQWLDELAQPFDRPRLTPLASTAQALRILNQSNQRLAAITGAQTDRMSRDDGWRLLSLGRHLERLDFYGLALREAINSGLWQTAPGVDALLALSDSSVAFHARFAQQRNLAALIDLLVLDGDHPRSITWIAKTLHARLRRLEHLVDGATLALAQRLPAASPNFALDTLDEAQCQALVHWLDQQRAAAAEVAQQLKALFFTHCHDAVHSVGD